MDFATLKFRDVFTEYNSALNALIYSATSTSGTAVKLGTNRKHVFHITLGSGSGSNKTWLMLGTASASTGAGFTSFGVTSALLGSVASASPMIAVMEVRDTYLETNSLTFSGGTWLVPLLSISGASIYADVKWFGFLNQYTPASNYDSAGGYFAGGELDFY